MLDRILQILSGVSSGYEIWYLKFTDLKWTFLWLDMLDWDLSKWCGCGIYMSVIVVVSPHMHQWEPASFLSHHISFNFCDWFSSTIQYIVEIFVAVGIGTSVLFILMGSRPQSLRRHAWRVQPLSESTGTPACTSHGSRQTILCGYLFNAHAERCALGLGVGEGEECCITLEPIADARLSFSDKILVSSFHPSLTGV